MTISIFTFCKDPIFFYFKTFPLIVLHTNKWFYLHFIISQYDGTACYRYFLFLLLEMIIGIFEILFSTLFMQKFLLSCFLILVICNKTLTALFNLVAYWCFVDFTWVISCIHKGDTHTGMLLTSNGMNRWIPACAWLYILKRHEVNFFKISGNTKIAS